MTSIIQVAIVVAAVALIFVGLGSRGTHSGRAWQKIGLIVLVLMMIIAVISPNAVNGLAHWAGVGRGADLLLYGTVVAFIFYAVSTYLYHQDQRDVLHRLARKIAILEANEKYGDKLK